MAKKLRKGSTVVKIEFANYVKDRIDEVVATGYFGDIDDFMQHAALSAIFDYETFENERILKELRELFKTTVLKKHILKLKNEV